MNAGTDPRAVCSVVIHPAQPHLVLAVRRIRDPGRGKWGLPGGMLAHREPPKYGAARELFEETAVSMHRPSAFVLYVGPCLTRGGTTITCITYYAPRWTGLPATMDEGEVAWQPWERVCEGPFADYNQTLRRILDLALSM